MADLEALALRCEAATPEMQNALLDQAWEACAEYSPAFRRFATFPLPSFDNNAGKFGMAMDAHAFESAALMLVPEGWRVSNWSQWKHEILRRQGTWLAILARDQDELAGFGTRCQHAATPALALAAAALRARASVGAHAERGDPLGGGRARP